MSEQQKSSPYVAILVAGVAILVVAVGFLLMSWPSGLKADPNDAGQVALGEQVYQQHCAECHGANLQGEPDWKSRLPSGELPAPPHDESGHTWHHPDDQLFQITKFGLAGVAPPGYVTKMPAYEGKLSDEQIWAVLAFIKSRWPEEVRERQSARGK